MKLIWESIMGTLLDEAMFILVLTLLGADSKQKREYRLLAGTFAVGLAFGTAAECLSGGGYAVIIIFALGFALALTAFVLTFPRKGSHDEGR